MKLVKNPFLTFILGIILSGSIVYTVTQIDANQVSYNKNGTTTTVDVVLNDLYTTVDTLQSKLSGLIQVDFDNITFVESKKSRLLNSNNGTVTYTNISTGKYFLHTIRTTSINDSNVIYATVETQNPTDTVDNGIVVNISNGYYVIEVTSDNSTITINSKKTGSSTTAGGYVYASLFSIN